MRSTVKLTVQNCLLLKTNRKPHPHVMSITIAIACNVVANHTADIS